MYLIKYMSRDYHFGICWTSKEKFSELKRVSLLHLSSYLITMQICGYVTICYGIQHNGPMEERLKM